MPVESQTIPDDHMKADRVGVPPGVSVAHLPSFELECGRSLINCPLAYTTYGTLNSAGENCVLVGHSLTSNTNVAEWWSCLIGAGPNRLLDLDRYYVVCVNYLGSPYGSASPLTLDPASQKHCKCTDANCTRTRAYGKHFPRVTMRDNVNAQKELLTKVLGVTHLAMAAGGSMGSMLALEMAASYPDFVSELLLVAGCAQHPDWAIGLGDSQRFAIYSDATWQHGDYMNHYRGKRGVCAKDSTTGSEVPEIHEYPRPDKGLYAARMAAMLTYRTPQSITARFARQKHQKPELDAVPNSKRIGLDSSENESESDEDCDLGANAYVRDNDLFSVESYLRYQGEKFVKRFDGACYAHLTMTLDSHDVGRQRISRQDSGVAMHTESAKRERCCNIMKDLPHRTLVVGIDSDNLYPIELQREMALCMPNSLLHTVKSPHGHDSFLIEIEELNKVTCEWRDGKYFGERVTECNNSDTRDWARAMDEVHKNGWANAMDQTPSARTVGIFL
ncbi:hypothetical protein SARC_09857 [Sphaeroforma arctica JP610]|uniref:AB hydrolase-1 domain-containing protein n=1 Tax=Sphaeroforma arctica JP610 TaxID=667725 RepID=A0A0L0FLN3_9EUKA|nr:hypothetical protein SARC_09857 [Sphaeroforma arctica JP610]KNC77687.1 hypothetical protein SARC_09857 [Sphaeroforma arctica JP610]|eukprot:XP_014151589.1 hypothetical protein SARC_09857 [Sphaeroforma arctica JP610]